MCECVMVFASFRVDLMSDFIMLFLQPRATKMVSVGAVVVFQGAVFVVIVVVVVVVVGCSLVHGGCVCVVCQSIRPFPEGFA